MRNHTIEFGDRQGKSFKMHIATPQNWELMATIPAGDVNKYSYRMTSSKSGKSNFGRANGVWRVIDKGFIRYNSGKIIQANSGAREGDLTTSDLYLT